MLLLQLNESKKRLDDQQETIDGHDDVKKKLQRDADALQQRVDSLTDENDRMNKSKKKMQTEVESHRVFFYITYVACALFGYSYELGDRCC